MRCSLKFLSNNVRFFNCPVCTYNTLRNSALFACSIELVTFTEVARGVTLSDGAVYRISSSFDDLHLKAVGVLIMSNVLYVF